MRILEKKRLTNDLPADRIFNLNDLDLLIQGKHHEEEDELD